MLPLVVPGGMEIGIVLLIFVLPLLFVIGVLLLVRDLFGRKKVGKDRFEKLEGRVRDLEREIEGRDSDSGSE